MIFSLLFTLLFASTPRIVTVDQFESPDFSKIWYPPAASDTLVGRVSVDTLTNKSIDCGNNTCTNIPGSAITGVVSIAHGGTNSSTSLNNNRVIKSSGGSIVEAAAITANKALISDANGIPTHSVTTDTELSYVSGVTSAIQTQIDGKQATGNYITSLTGDVTASGPGAAAATIANLAVTNAKIANTTIDLTSKVAGILPNANTTATSANTASAIVARDGSGNFIANIITAALSGNATTATALASNPTDCSSNQYANAIDASGNLTCSQVTTAQLSGNINLATQTTGTLGVGNGGTGQTTYTDGQLLIGNTTGNTLTKATLTQGTGITITNGSGSITIAATGGGDVSSNTATSVDSEIALFSGTGGKTIKRATGTGVAHVTSGVLSASNVALTSEVTGILPTANGGTNNSSIGGAGTIAHSDGSKITYTAAGNSGQRFISQGTSTPIWETTTGFHYSSSSGQTLTAGATTTILYPTKDFDRGGTTVVSGVYTTPAGTDGLYQANACINIAAQGTGPSRIIFQFTKNSTVVARIVFNVVSNGQSYCLSDLINLVATDTLKAEVNTDASGTITLGTESSRNYFSAIRVGP